MVVTALKAMLTTSLTAAFRQQEESDFMQRFKKRKAENRTNNSVGLMIFCVLAYTRPRKRRKATHKNDAVFHRGYGR